MLLFSACLLYPLSRPKYYIIETIGYGSALVGLVRGNDLGDINVCNITICAFNLDIILMVCT